MFTEEDLKSYAALQYQSLREAILKTRDTQNTILGWNQAIVGGLFVAAFVSDAQLRDHIAAQFIFGLILPAVLLSGALAWSGELIRMSRAGMFLRAFERAVWVRGEADGRTESHYFMWENFLWSPPDSFKKVGYHNQNTGYVGFAIFYFILYVGSLAGFATVSPWWVSVIVCCAAVAFGAMVMVPTARKIFRLGGSTPALSACDLAAWLDLVPRVFATEVASQGAGQAVKRKLFRSKAVVAPGAAADSGVPAGPASGAGGDGRDEDLAGEVPPDPDGRLAD